MFVQEGILKLSKLFLKRQNSYILGTLSYVAASSLATGQVLKNKRKIYGIK
jgi:hypothetical protein